MLEQIDVLAARIEQRIYIIREERIMLSTDLAILYDVEVRMLNQAVQRNRSRFPADFMFQLTSEEVARLKSQSVISRRKGSQSLPFAFTEQGVAMLSSILRSERAIEVNVEIIRAFVRLRRFLASHEDLRKKLEALEQKYDGQFQIVFEAIHQMIEPLPTTPRKMGFQLSEEE